MVRSGTTPSCLQWPPSICLFHLRLQPRVHSALCPVGLRAQDRPPSLRSTGCFCTDPKVSPSNPERPVINKLQTAWLHGRKTQEPRLGPPSFHQPSGFLRDKGDGGGHNPLQPRGRFSKAGRACPGSGEGSGQEVIPAPWCPAASAGARQDWLHLRIFQTSSAICVGEGVTYPILNKSSQLPWDGSSV